MQFKNKTFCENLPVEEMSDSLLQIQSKGHRVRFSNVHNYGKHIRSYH
jgi:hypothetical protein